MIDLGEVVLGSKKGRENDREPIFFILGGMGVQDVAWSYEVYLNAQKLGLGQELELWDTPHVV